MAQDIRVCVSGFEVETVTVQEINGYLVEIDKKYSGVAHNKETVTGSRVFSKDGSFVGLLCGPLTARGLVYVDEVSMFSANE